MKDTRHEYPHSGRVKIMGHVTSDDGLVSGLGTAGRTFVEGYESAKQKSETARAKWISGLKALGVKAAHADDGWHDREENSFALCYPSFDDGLKIGDMCALGEPGKFVVVIVSKISGIFSRRYHYKSNIY